MMLGERTRFVDDGNVRAEVDWPVGRQACSHEHTYRTIQHVRFEIPKHNVRLKSDTVPILTSAGNFLVYALKLFLS